tara:strand:- start:38107 stop:38982 length:876 start_codon:yes stop_codon:yes gene_type:complete
MINKLTVIGVGLIGGSFALALRKAGLVRKINGLGRSKKNLEHALKLGIIDEASTNYAEALERTDLVLIAAPVGQINEILKKIKPFLGAKTIITDVGSTKQDIVEAIRLLIPDSIKNFVPSHPIAGAELSGAHAANADLFIGKNIILTPLNETNTNSIETLSKLWESCGASISMMNPYQHDKLLAMTSHLPHMLAFTFMNYISSNNTEENAESIFNFSGGGFQDFTRIAASSPEMWKDICLSNRRQLIQQIRSYQNELAHMNELIEDGNSLELEKFFLKSQKARKKLQKFKN